MSLPWLNLSKNSLFARTLLMLIAALLLFQLIFYSLSSWFIMRPILQMSVDDLSNIIITTVGQWQKSSASQRNSLQHKYYQTHKIKIFSGLDENKLETVFLPYLLLLQKQLEKKLQKTVSIGQIDLGQTWYIMSVPLDREVFHIGFTEHRIGTRPLLVIILVIVTSVVLSILTAWLIAKRVTFHIRRFSRQAVSLGEGKQLSKLPESGDLEFIQLTRKFNEMSEQIHSLLANRTTLLFGVSHDLRTPLAKIRIAIELLKTQVNSPKLEKIENNIDSMNDTISQFLILAKGLELEKLQIQPIHKILLALTKELQTTPERIIFQGEECQISIQSTAFKQVLSNLIENALNYSPNDKEVLVTMQCLNTTLNIEICDQGDGIPAEKRDVIFEPFTRLEASRNLNTGGRGIGLALVKLICSNYGWQIKVNGNMPKGTKMSLLIPI